MGRNNRGVDIFAEIAARGGKSQRGRLVEPKPPKIPDVFLPFGSHDLRARFEPQKKIDTPEELKRELQKYRQRYAKFMQNLAPKHKKTRSRQYLRWFDWGIETREDKSDFRRVLDGKGSWEKVKVPHFGPPIGKAVTYYRTSFNLTKSMLNRGSLFIHFKGVDYKAHIFINGNYLGSHTGFFAPFEFEFTDVAELGKNILVVKVENDVVCMGNHSWDGSDDRLGGDKIYAATGPGYDEPEVGWHHCPPGMGIFQDVYIEARNRIFIYDIFVRPILEEKRAEAWIEVYNCDNIPKKISIMLSLFGRNFRKTVFRNEQFQLSPAGPGINFYRVAFKIPNVRVWDLETPWLYQLQVDVIDEKGKTVDISSQHFGMRSFKMDEDSVPRGRMYLNGRQIRLRGANTMGHLQQCVIRKDWNQLRDDIFLAKICNMNFFRLTQRPVQSEIYDYCDMLGMMTQTDLPLFGVLRRNLFCEAVKQAEEMERLVRSHPCNIMVTYINEPFPPNDPHVNLHRHLTRDELEMFFEAANQAVRLVNPDRVIKPVDGDYNPPAPGLPDNHCYCCWYNGHGIDVGKLHKGYWQRVKPGWFYGCGEFGTEGLDFVGIMKRYYPKHWLPKNKAEEKTWIPDLEHIPHAQTGNFHYMWFDSADSLEEWVRLSQNHQAWATRIMTEAFRRDSRMVSFAIHLFIDAFPSGWMKAIMDFKRNPKPAYFVYRDALTPLMVSLRTDRFQFFADEPIEVEVWICNDLDDSPNNLNLHYQIEMDGKVIRANKTGVDVPRCSSRFIGKLKFKAPGVDKRTKLILRAGLVDKDRKNIHDNTITLNIFPRYRSAKRSRRVVILGAKAKQLAHQLGVSCIQTSRFTPDDCILISDYNRFEKNRKQIMRVVEEGAIAVFLELPEGKFNIGDTPIEVQRCGMNPVHFVSRKTFHPMVSDFEPDDFKFWYDESANMVTPILETTFIADGFVPILKSGNGRWGRNIWYPTLAAGERRFGDGLIRICQVKLVDRVNSNCTARIFTERLLGLRRFQ